MKKTAATLLTEERFWAVIENSDKGMHLAEELHKLSEDEIWGYCYWWDHFHRESYDQALWAVAYVVLGGCSDDCFDYFRYWLVTRGQSVYRGALQDADSLCGEFEDLTDEPLWEEIAYVPRDVYTERFGKDFYDEACNIDFGEQAYPEIQFVWDENHADSIRKICPNTFDRWWNNEGR